MQIRHDEPGTGAWSTAIANNLASLSGVVRLQRNLGDVGLNLQKRYDLRQAERAPGETIKNIPSGLLTGQDI